MNTISKAIALALAAHALVAVPPVIASDRVQVSKRVFFADLDLSSAEGRQALDKRVGRAIRAICIRPGSRDFDAISDQKRCIAEARASAQPQVALAIAKYRPRNQGEQMAVR